MDSKKIPRIRIIFLLNLAVNPGKPKSDSQSISVCNRALKGRKWTFSFS